MSPLAHERACEGPVGGKPGRKRVDEARGAKPGRPRLGSYSPHTCLLPCMSRCLEFLPAGILRGLVSLRFHVRACARARGEGEMSGEVYMAVRKLAGGGYVVEGSGRESFSATAVTRFEEIAGVLRRAFGEFDTPAEPEGLASDRFLPLTGTAHAEVVKALRPGVGAVWQGRDGVITGTVKEVRADQAPPVAVMENGMVAPFDRIFFVTVADV